MNHPKRAVSEHYWQAEFADIGKNAPNLLSMLELLQLFAAIQTGESLLGTTIHDHENRTL